MVQCSKIGHLLFCKDENGKEHQARWSVNQWMRTNHMGIEGFRDKQHGYRVGRETKPRGWDETDGDGGNDMGMGWRLEQYLIQCHSLAFYYSQLYILLLPLFLFLCKHHCLTFSPPIPLRLYTLPYWSNPPFLILDIRVLWCSVLSTRAPECQKLKLVG